MGLVSLNNSRELWALGSVPSCPVPGPGMTEGRESAGLVYEFEEAMVGHVRGLLLGNLFTLRN